MFGDYQFTRSLSVNLPFPTLPRRTSKYAVNRPSYRLQFAIHNFANRADLLRYYLAINSGGTPHSTSEIERVKGLLAAADRAV